MKKNLLIGISLLAFALGCKSEKKDDNSLALLALLAASSSSTTCTTSFGDGVPDWIKNSFTCVTVSVSGSNYVFKTSSTPTYKSVYWGSSSSLYESSLYSNTTGSNAANPNKISSQNITITVPKDNTTNGTPATGFGAIGVATNGIVIYNDQAAPGDSLSTEYYTFDTSQGHPTNTGAYHYHVEPPKISNNDSNLVGIALDGYLIFGKKHDSTATSNATFSLGGASSSTACTLASKTTEVPTTWAQASNYNATKTSGSARHYHVNSGSEVNGIILSGKYIGTAGTSL